MLPRLYRLPARKRFMHSKTVKTQLFECKFEQNNINRSRFGFVVSKNIDKRAPVRNRTKRMFRSIIEANLQNIRQGYDYLFILRRQIQTITPEVERLIVAALGKENIL